MPLSPVYSKRVCSIADLRRMQMQPLLSSPHYTASKSLPPSSRVIRTAQWKLAATKLDSPAHFAKSIDLFFLLLPCLLCPAPKFRRQLSHTDTRRRKGRWDLGFCLGRGRRRGGSKTWSQEENILGWRRVTPISPTESACPKSVRSPQQWGREGNSPCSAGRSTPL